MAHEFAEFRIRRRCLDSLRESPRPHFGQLPVYALLANILVLPVVPYAMLFGFLALVPFLGPGFGFVAKLILDYMLAIIGWVASWPGAVWKVSVAPAAVLVVYLFLLAAFFWALRKTRPG